MASPLHLTALPSELLIHSLSLLPKQDLLRVRLVNRRLSVLATPVAFHSIRLASDGNGTERLRAIAGDAELRTYIREVVIVTWPEPADNVNADFIHSFLCLSLFRGLESLHVEFHEKCGDEDVQYNSIRVHILGILFLSLGGKWTREQEKMAQEAGELYEPDSEDEADKPATVDGPPIQLSTLTIRNLGDNHEPELIALESFKLVLCPKLRDLRLYITTEGEDEWGNNDSISKYVSFQNLHTSWLSPDVVANLDTLSLYCQEPWGFTPKMDFRHVLGGFPNLRVLALGNYTFSHEWQITWFGSLKLEKLCLDDCAVLFAYEYYPSEMDSGETVVGQDDSGNDIAVSNEGYMEPVPEEIDARTERREFGLAGMRWHTILSHRQKTMTSLRVFKMGKGHWAGRGAFRTFDSAEPKHDAFRFGSGLSREKPKELPYLIYPDQWNRWEERYRDAKAEVEEEGGDWDSDIEGFYSPWRGEDGLQAKDAAALDLLVSTVEARART